MDPQLSPSDVSFWQDMTPDLYSSLASLYKYPYDKALGTTNEENFNAAMGHGSPRVETKGANAERISVRSSHFSPLISNFDAIFSLSKVREIRQVT